MKKLQEMPESARKNIRYVLTDIDDTLTTEGRMPAAAYAAMERLRDAGISVIPITGRPAGWCDHFARMWPVEGIVGENGAFYFRYDEKQRKMVRRYVRDEEQRKKDKLALLEIEKDVLSKVPGCMISADQAYREADLAVDFCEDVPALSNEAIDAIVECFEKKGAVAKISSIHVNGWFGSYDKLTTTSLFFKEVFGKDLEEIKESVVFTGDSPNDAPMFGYFPNSTGVANVLAFEDTIESKPAWITRNEGGEGFAEMVEILLG